MKELITILKENAMFNKKVVLLSIIALGFLVLTFLIDWLFIIGAVIIILINQRELMKKK